MTQPIDRDVPAKILEYLNNHPGVALALLAAGLNLIGICYSSFLLGRYGLNFFDFAEIEDFLISAFRNPLIILYNCLIVFVFTVFTIIRNRDALQYPRISLSVLFLIFFAVPSVTGLIEPSSSILQTLTSNKYTAVHLLNQTGEQHPPLQNIRLENVRIIAKAGDFLVFIDTAQNAHVVNRSLVTRIFERN